MDILAKPYECLPCRLKEFSINGIEAEQDDFGRERDIYDGDNPTPYCCDNMQFIPKEATQDVLDKYGITKDDYDLVCRDLLDLFNIGPCGWCG